jgi:hypothetical protein
LNATAIQPAAAADARFFARMSWVMLASILLAFSMTYLKPLVAGSGQFIALRHIHGGAFFLWIALYTWQSQLVAAGKTARHRSIGLFAFTLSGAMLPLGVWMLLVATEERLAAGNPAAYYLGFFSVFDMVSFGGLIAAAVATAMRRTDWHKRFIYAAAIALVGPAISRWFIPLPVISPWTDMGPNLLADMLFVPLALYDRRKLGRIHPATLIACLAIVPMHVAEPWIADSAWWTALAPKLLGGS